MTFFQKTVWFPGFFADMRGVVEGREGRENWAIRKEKKSAIGRRHFLQLNRKGHMVKSITLDNLSTNILPAFLAFLLSPQNICYSLILFSFCTGWFISLHTLSSLIQNKKYSNFKLTGQEWMVTYGASVRPEVFECASSQCSNLLPTYMKEILSWRTKTTVT